MNEYERLIAEFMREMAEVGAPTGDYLDALCDVQAQIEAAIDAAKEDLKKEEDDATR